MAQQSDAELKLQYFTGWIGIIALAVVLCSMGSCMRGCNKDDNEFRLKKAEIEASQPKASEAAPANVKITVENK